MVTFEGKSLIGMAKLVPNFAHGGKVSKDLGTNPTQGVSQSGLSICGAERSWILQQTIHVLLLINHTSSHQFFEKIVQIRHPD
jgi:hypothetical protein